MMTSEHQSHIAARISHNACPECRADNERSFVDRQPFKYGHVREYLAYVRPRLEAIKTGQYGGSSLDARWWHRRFIQALNRRISSHVPQSGRKYSDGYIERLKMATKGRDPNACYLRSFAARGASCLDR